MIPFVLISVLLLAGCNTIAEKDDATAPGAAISEAREINDIYWINYSYRESVFFSPMGWQYSINDQMKDSTLQNAVSKIEIDYPIVSEEQIQTYAWALYEICMDRELFSSDLIPAGAKYYSDNICFLSFLPAEYVGSYYDGPAAHFLISGIDGHIIHYEVEKCTGDGSLS